ncbi:MULTISPECIES: winged helix-turn-helix transcriptional regulator [Actinopolyspora]|uniref:DNA-binding response regulator, OmpR family, contains REC and winged-helix (WHTH) domain n=1 Tax=Actinopolyspora saharensis TaxID=995062 RepID=A0A1H1G5S4_9ACTN|nr:MULTISPECIES: response regulator transcription factor [Actinopolyspora]NHD16375.1 response regulator transcription factor [Actinopolyspora sp. BKK2]NHE75762.1 response regulator transcription factor [Actinopolyspora sp. BKK1]SDR08584.1 DNA-binding response regulator, OmpR family, contains REC and winged-helix (wHTH) domain [Actinopolyspora saharensis]
MSSELLLLTNESDCDSVLPALSLLPHRVRIVPPNSSAMVTTTGYELVLVDARDNLAAARNLCRMLSSGDEGVPVLAVVNEGGLVVVNAEWGVDDVLLPTTGPAEVDARIRLRTAQRGGSSTAGGPVTVGDLVIEEETYTARLKGRALELTYKEFELLKHLATHAGRVFTRVQLLQEVWGYDFFGGTRTVDVHIRRLRSKLGPEHEAMIGTVRSVGYKFVRPSRTSRDSSGSRRADSAAHDAEQAEFTSRMNGAEAELSAPDERNQARRAEFEYDPAE